MGRDIFIATPAYGGMTTVAYTHSLVTTVVNLNASGITWNAFFIENESLIQRARNKLATEALDKGHRKLLFIDADIHWSWPDVKKLYDADLPVIAGTYPKKTLPIELNFNPLPDDLVKYFDDKPLRTKEHLQRWQESDAVKNGVARVMHVPTGFMMIDISVLRKLKDKVLSYTNQDGSDLKRCYDFFPVRVKWDILESEDWAFCSLCRENDIPVYFHTEVVLDHIGTYHFKGK